MERGTVGRNINAHRHSRGLTLDQLGARVELSKDQLSKIENGTRGVEVSEAARIADALGVTLGDLLGQVRSTSLALAARVMSPVEDGAATTARRRVRQVLEVDSILGASVGRSTAGATAAGMRLIEMAASHPHVSATNEGAGLAKTMREALGLEGAPTADLPELIERHFDADVLIWPTGEAVSGLCAHGDGVALLFASSSFPRGHQRFTLAHELAHHLFDDPIEVVVDEDLNGQGTTPEVRANAFATELLMPEEVLTDIVGGQRVDATTLAVLMRTLGVSCSALLVRLRTLGLMTRDEEASWRARSVSSVLIDAGDQAPGELVQADGTKRVPARLWRAAQRGYVDGRVGIGVLAGLRDVDADDLFLELSAEGITPPVRTVDRADL